MKKEHAAGLLARFISGEISSRDEELLLRALAKSPELQKELGNEMVTDALLRAKLGRDKPGQELCDQILQRLSSIEEEAATEDTSALLPEKRLSLPAVMLRMAAAILLLFGIGYVIYISQEPEEQETATGHLALAEGRAYIRRGKEAIQATPSSALKIASGDRIIIRPGSRGSISLDDSSVISANSGTHMLYLKGTDKTGKTLQLDKGEVYLNVTAQKHPFSLHVGSARVMLLGTQIHVVRKEQREQFSGKVIDMTIVTVYEGKVKIKRENQSVYLSPGECALFGTTENESHVRILRGPALASKSMPGWFRKMGISPPARDASETTLSDSNRHFKGTNLMVVAGIWRVEKFPPELIAVQEDVSGRGLAIFNDVLPPRGRISCRHRITKATSKNPKFMFSPFYMKKDGGFEVFGAGFGDILSRFSLNEWMILTADYRITKGNIFTYERMSVSSESNPKKAFDAVLKNPTHRGDQPASEERLLGLETHDCSVEITSISVTPRSKPGKKPAGRQP